MVLLALGSLCDHYARKCAVLVLVWCYKPTGDREQELWRYWLPECCIKQRYDKPTGDGWLQEVWAGGAMKQWHCCILYLIQVPICTVCTHKVQIHFWSTPLTRVFIDVAENSVLPLQFLRSVSILWGCHIIIICVGHQDMKWSRIGPMAYHPHISFFYFRILM